MGLLTVLTVIFIVLKLVGVIAWSWWLVFTPTFILIGLYVLWFFFIGMLGLAGVNVTVKHNQRKRK